MQPLIKNPIDPACKTIIVIPCCNEPDLIGTLNSLKDCEQLDYLVEVIVVLNHSESASFDVKQTNEKTLNSFQKWQLQNPLPMLQFHLLEAFNQPIKNAGVGLARKTGMDEAVRRFSSISQNGSIVCLDADCHVSENYLTTIDRQFVSTDAGIGIMNFEHQFEAENDINLRVGIINYELFLRYYVEGLRQSLFPNAIHTIGSCMLVKAAIYAKHGGMNKRKAGEDFYFLHKIVPHEKFVTIDKGTVYPSCRTSDRVPFGTGKAQQDWLNKDDNIYLTYDPQVFNDLKMLNESIQSMYLLEFKKWFIQMPKSIQDFFEVHGYAEKLDSIRANCRTFDQFKKQFYVWFDGFLCLKFIHYARDNFYPNISLTDAAGQLISVNSNNPIELLVTYKAKEGLLASSF